MNNPPKWLLILSVVFMTAMAVSALLMPPITPLILAVGGTANGVAICVYAVKSLKKTPQPE